MDGERDLTATEPSAIPNRIEASQPEPETTAAQEPAALARPVKIKVLFDSEDVNRRRTCFWQRLAAHQFGNAALGFSFVSIRDSMKRGEHPISTLADDETDILILNWDVINGDPVYGSDLSLSVVEHYRPDLENWVKTGGIVIVECQAAADEMNQRAYRIFAENGRYPIKLAQVDVAVDAGHGWSAHFSSKLLPTHPIIQKLRQITDRDTYGEFTLRDRESYVGPLFPPKHVRRGMRSLQERERFPSLFRGWFSNLGTHSQWERILFGDHSEAGDKRPIMLCRTARGDRTAGAIILTTMYLARSNWIDLITALFALPGRISPYHDRRSEITKRRQQQSLFVTVFSLLAIGVVGGLAYWFGSTGAALASALLTAVVTAIGQFPLRAFLDQRARSGPSVAPRR